MIRNLIFGNRGNFTWMVRLLTVLLILSGLSAIKTPASAEEVVWGPWHGTFSITSSEHIISTSTQGFIRSGSGQYTDIGYNGNDFQAGESNPYRAFVDVSFNENNYSTCGDGAYSMESEWSFVGNSEDAVHASNNGSGYSYGTPGTVLFLDDSDDGSQTFALPTFVQFNAPKKFPSCNGSQPYTALQSNSTMSLYAGNTSWIGDPLNDTDADPARLVGSMVWTTGMYPTSNPPFNYEDYSYSIEYDLTREPLGGPNADQDGDGIPNDTDNCPSDSNSSQLDIDKDGMGDACDSDIDGDGLDNTQESSYGTSPTNPDTDGDGWSDGYEVKASGTSPIKSDTDDDGRLDPSDPCPVDAANRCVPQPTLPPPPPIPGNFSCDTLGTGRKNYEPTYSVRIKAQAWPDLEMFRFEPLLVACWNGVDATWKTPSLYNFVDGGLDQVVLNSLGFEIAEDNSKRVARVVGNEAEVSANFNFEFKVSKLFDKLGVKGHMQKRVKNQVAKNLERYLKKNNVTGPQLGDALRQQAWFISREMNDFAAKFRGRLKTARVPSKVADPMASWVEDEIKAWTRDYRQWVGAMSRDNAFRDKTADYIAGKIVGKLFSFFDPKITMLVWRPNYIYTLSKEGAISKRNGENHFKNPFLTLKSKE